MDWLTDLLNGGPDPDIGSGDSDSGGFDFESMTPLEWIEFILGLVGQTVQTVYGAVNVAGPGAQPGTFRGTDGNTYSADDLTTQNQPGITYAPSDSGNGSSSDLTPLLLLAVLFLAIRK